MYSSSISNRTLTTGNFVRPLINPTLTSSLSAIDGTYSTSTIFTTLFSTTNTSFFTESNLTCYQIKEQYVERKPLFIIVRYISQNLNRFFILPALVLNLCAFYILRRTRMNRSSSIAFYMQTLALCDVAFFALRVIFDELSRSRTGRQILTTGLCKFLFLMVNAVNYMTVWLIAAMNADKFLAVCLPLRVSDLLSRKKAYAVVLAVIICSMLVASVHASRTVLLHNAYCWLKTPQDEKLVFILDSFFSCFIPFIVISVLNAAIFLALLRARREASQLHESTSSSNLAKATRSSNNGRSKSGSVSNFLRTPTNNSPSKTTFRSSTSNISASNRNRIQSQNLQITIMLITISISFFVLTLPNAIYHLLIFLRVLLENWRAVKCDGNVYRNLDVYVRTSAVMYLISNITSDLMHVVNFFLYFISGARFRSEFRRLIFSQLCPWFCKGRIPITGKDIIGNERSFVRSSGAATVRTLAILPAAGIQNERRSISSFTMTNKDKPKSMKTTTPLSSRLDVTHDADESLSLEGKARKNQYATVMLSTIGSENPGNQEAESLLAHK